MVMLYYYLLCILIFYNNETTLIIYFMCDSTKTKPQTLTAINQFNLIADYSLFILT
ncbi:hypothetical protein BN1323_170008 [Staphylococcus aureus]|nr:hypothetical protein BN1323_170008 [Staphylococcus aureus]CRI21584.1 hypothetical protein BN1322_380008 [Staphylococcus aureus]CRI21842.1 hypothetical protein SAET23_370008 [Staphylococcus aureus]CRI28110.1 hypothetical protein SAET23_370008 [Staphylococcus aureus]